MVGEKEQFRSIIVQGFGTLIIREFFIKVFSFVGQILLARLLLPSDFGTYVIIVFIIMLLGFFSDIGLSHALIQKKTEPTKVEIDSVLFLKIALAVGLMLLLVIVSPLITLLYPSFSNETLFMTYAMSFTLLLTAIRSVPIALLERKINYNMISFIDIIGLIVYYVAALTAAYFQMGIWSFIIGALLKELVETIVLYIYHPVIPSFTFTKTGSKKLMKFGAFIQGNSLVLFSTASITPVIGGRMSGPHAVGLLDFANSLASLPEIIAVNFGRVAFASYSRMQEQKELLHRSITKSITMLVILLYFFPVLIFAFGNEIVGTLYTVKWLEAIPALYWFGGMAFFQPIITTLGQGILATGNSKSIFRVTLYIAICGWISAILLVTYFGFIGIAITSFFISMCLCLSYVFIFRTSGYVFPLMSFFPKITAFAVSLLFAFFLNNIFPTGPHFLFVKILIAGVIYIGCMYFFAKNDTVSFFEIIKAFLKSKKHD